MMKRLLIWGMLALITPPLVASSILIAIDTWRKRYHSQGKFSSPLPEPVRVRGSEVQIYTYGADLYEAMLHAIRHAQKRIVLETFIWKGDKVGQRFKQELLQASERGVEVYIIYDTFANLVVPPSFKRFPPSIHVLAYPILSWPVRPLQIRTYARDHRKILVVDGGVAFVGGYNIGEAYATEWRDTHARIVGPDACELENIFADLWNAYRGKHLPEPPHCDQRNWDPHIAIHRNDPQMLIFPIRSTYLEAIDRAQHNIYLTHAYFIPDRIILRALLDAAARGVDVCILLPQTSNHVIADWLARGYYTQCLESGIRLLLYQKAMVHAKTATIDGVWSTVGTANLDRLSLVGNFEANVEFYDQALAQQMEEIFAQDSLNTRELILEKWQQRPVLWKLAEMMLLSLRPFF